MWTERELRDLIPMEVSTGQTMQVLNAAIASAELTAGIAQISSSTHSGFTAQATQVTLLAAEFEATKIKIEAILREWQTFVQRTQDESNTAKRGMSNEVAALET